LNDTSRGHRLIEVNSSRVGIGTILGAFTSKRSLDLRVLFFVMVLPQKQVHARMP